MDLYINIPASIEHKIAWQHVANNRLNGFFSLLFDIRDRNTSSISTQGFSHFTHFTVSILSEKTPLPPESPLSHPHRQL